MKVPFQRGMTFGFYARRGVYSSNWAKEQICRMKALGVEYVGLIATVFRETDYSTREFLDLEESPGEIELARMIDFIHAQGLKVMFRPMLESHEGNGRLQVNFAYDRERIPGKVSDRWKRWFRSVRARTRLFASLARETGCEIYGLDSELDRTVCKTSSGRRSSPSPATVLTDRSPAVTPIRSISSGSWRGRTTGSAISTFCRPVSITPPRRRPAQRWRR